MFNEGDKITLLSDDPPNSIVYDFGYYSRTEGYCVLYYEGERNMQNSFAVKIKEVKHV